MKSPEGALTPSCAECEALWLPADDAVARLPRGRLPRLPRGDSLDEVPEVVLICAACPEREFGD
jgi:hypothetical protein